MSPPSVTVFPLGIVLLSVHRQNSDTSFHPFVGNVLWSDSALSRRKKHSSIDRLIWKKKHWSLRIFKWFTPSRYCVLSGCFAYPMMRDWHRRRRKVAAACDSYQLCLFTRAAYAKKQTLTHSRIRNRHEVFWSSSLSSEHSSKKHSRKDIQ